MKKLFFKKLGIFATVFVFLFSNFSFAAAGLSHRSWSGDPNEPFIEVNNNKPEFTDAEIAKAQKGYFIELSKLDKLGRCGSNIMCVDVDKMPKDERGDIGSVTPSGWKYNKKSNNNKYPGVVSGGYIYNRCHLLGFQLSSLNDDKKNLITGTRFMNTIGMLPFENDVAGYVKKTGKHVLYRVTPIFEGNNLIAEGVKMEGWSVEDGGKSICFNVFCFNVQNGVEINYLTGENWLESDTISAMTSQQQQEEVSTTQQTGGVSAGAATGGGVGAVLFFAIIAWFIFKQDKPNDGNNGSGQMNSWSGYNSPQNWGPGSNSNLFG